MTAGKKEVCSLLKGGKDSARYGYHVDGSLVSDFCLDGKEHAPHRASPSFLNLIISGWEKIMKTIKAIIMRQFWTIRMVGAGPPVDVGGACGSQSPPPSRPAGAPATAAHWSSTKRF
jgi:hypothetical protein